MHILLQSLNKLGDKLPCLFLDCTCKEFIQMRLKVAGVGRKNGRGMPLSVVQEEIKNDKAKLLRTRGTVKAAALMNDKDIPNLVAVSVHDTKPVHFLSAICDSVEWIEKQRKVWNQAKEEHQNVEFLRLNINDEHNNKMNDVDVSDQLRNHYRFDHWLRNYKWWWAAFLHCFGALMVNPHCVYVSVVEAAGIPKKDGLTHCEFRLEAARVWIAKDGLQRMQRWKERWMNPNVNQQEADESSSESDVEVVNPAPITRKRGRSPATSPPRVSPQPMTPAGSVKAGHGFCTPCKETPVEQSPALVDAVLTPSGRLNGRLNFFGVKHLPMSRESAGKTKNIKCALHRWAVGRQCDVRLCVTVCRDCNAALCPDCYSVFHEVEDLTAIKGELKSKMLAIRPIVRIPSNSHPKIAKNAGNNNKNGKMSPRNSKRRR